MGSVTVTYTPGSREGPTVIHGTGSVFTTGGRQDAPGLTKQGGVKAKGKPGFIRGKGWGINLSLGLPALPGRGSTVPGIGIPEVVPGPVVWIPQDVDLKTVIGQPPTSNEKELPVAAEQAAKQAAQQAARVRMMPVALASPAQVACNY